MNQYEVALTKSAVFVSQKYAGNYSAIPAVDMQMAMTLAAEMGRYGFLPDRILWNTLTSISQNEIIALHKNLLPLLAKTKGAHVKHKPMYKGFPQEVLDMSHFELFIKAIVHYWSKGTWMPESEDVPRELKFEQPVYTTLTAWNVSDIKDYTLRLIKANQSWTPVQREIVEYMFLYLGSKNFSTAIEDIPFKENLCIIAGLCITKHVEFAIFPKVETTTDILRIITYLSGGDISLATNTKFKSLPRRLRRFFLKKLEDIVREEDIQRHRNKWVRLFHMLHVGEYRLTYSRIFAVATKIRNGGKIRTFNSTIENCFKAENPTSAAKELVKRPGEYARRMAHLITIGEVTRMPKTEIVSKLLKPFTDGPVNAVPSRILLEMVKNILVRSRSLGLPRVIYPKGSLAKAQLLKNKYIPIDPTVAETFIRSVGTSLCKRFATLEPLGNMYVDERLKKCPLPTALRSASRSFFTVARGTRLPVVGKDMDTIRLFLYWVGIDIDLSAVFWNEDFTKTSNISYLNLKDQNMACVHSGDIVRAPNGASEFVDIPIREALAADWRYVQMSLHVFNGPSFKEHEECFVGWMLRSAPKSNEIFDPKTVQQKIDLTSESKTCTPALFDLKTREVIWSDLTYPAKYHRRGNNVYSNRATLEDLLKVTLLTSKTRATLFELFMLHGSRGNLVENKSDADIVFDIDGEGAKEGATIITPYDIDVIVSEYLI